MKIVDIPESALRRHLFAYYEAIKAAMSQALLQVEGKRRDYIAEVAQCHQEGLLLSSRVGDMLKAIKRLGEINDSVLKSVIKGVFNYDKFVKGSHPIVKPGSGDLTWRKNVPIWSKADYLKELGSDFIDFHSASPPFAASAVSASN